MCVPEESTIVVIPIEPSVTIEERGRSGEDSSGGRCGNL